MIKQHHPADLDYSDIDNFKAQQFFTTVRAFCPDCDFIPQYAVVGVDKHKVSGYLAVYNPHNVEHLGFTDSLMVGYNKVHEHEWYNIYGGLVDGKWHRATKIDALDELNNFMKRVSVGPKKMF